MRGSRLPIAKCFFDELQHFGAREIADSDEERVRRNVILAIEPSEVFNGVRGDLRFGGRNHGVRTLSEQNATKTLARGESRSSAFDFQFFDALAALALEFLRRKRSAFGEIRD